MASLRRKSGTGFWFACYTDGEGKRIQRSTKCTTRAEAQKIADAYEGIHRRKQTETQVRRTMSKIFEEVHGEALGNLTLGDWLALWLARVKSEVRPRTWEKYKGVVALAGKLAPAACTKLLDRVEMKDVLALREALVACRSRSTTNNYLKILRSALKLAWMDGLVMENVAARVPNVRAGQREAGGVKRPFTIEELQALLRIADDEWRGMIFAGLYTAGQRLGDIATMTAGQVDLAAGEVRFSTDKTGRDVLVPIVPAWEADLKKRVQGRAAGERLFPVAYGRYVAGGNAMRVSASFRRMLANLGLVPRGNRAREGAVVGRRRALPLSFHSFRHTATSMLKNAGVSDVVARDIVGHESAAISASYTHIDRGTKRAAMALLPVLR